MELLLTYSVYRFGDGAVILLIDFLDVFNNREMIYHEKSIYR